jgi:hypothetical protein
VSQALALSCARVRLFSATREGFDLGPDFKPGRQAARDTRGGFFMPVRVVREAGFAFPRAAEASMWTSWMARTLASHDEADYAARRARRPALGDWDVTVLRGSPEQAPPPVQLPPADEVVEMCF